MPRSPFSSSVEHDDAASACTAGFEAGVRFPGLSGRIDLRHPQGDVAGLGPFAQPVKLGVLRCVAGHPGGAEGDVALGFAGIPPY